MNLVAADRVSEEIVNNEAYILFYQRRKIDNAECSGSSSGSSDHWVSKITAAPSTNSANTSVRASAATLNLDEKKETQVNVEKETNSIGGEVSFTHSSLTINYLYTLRLIFYFFFIFSSFRHLIKIEMRTQPLI